MRAKDLCPGNPTRGAAATAGGLIPGGPVELSEEDWDFSDRLQSEDRLPGLQVRAAHHGSAGRRHGEGDRRPRRHVPDRQGGRYLGRGLRGPVPRLGRGAIRHRRGDRRRRRRHVEELLTRISHTACPQASSGDGGTAGSVRAPLPWRDPHPDPPPWTGGRSGGGGGSRSRNAEQSSILHRYETCGLR